MVICDVCGKEFKSERSLKTHKTWENNPDRKIATSLLATKRNKEGTFSQGRPKGSKNVNPYPKVTREFSKETLAKMSERFTKMNLARSKEDYERITKVMWSHYKAAELTPIERRDRIKPKKWDQDSWENINLLFDMDASWDDVKDAFSSR